MTEITKRLSQSALHALVASSLIVSLLFATFMIVEPTVGRTQNDSATFLITQQITDETTFLVDPGNVTASGTINGITGGQATGTSGFVVRSNNPTGYYVDIIFNDRTGTQAMYGNTTGDESLRDYDFGGLATSTPTLNMTASTAPQFAYTVNSSTTADTGILFRDDGTYCGGGTANANTCWMQPSTTAIEIVNASDAAANGASSTLTFVIHVPSGANPQPQADTYTATATLSLFTQ